MTFNNLKPFLRPEERPSPGPFVYGGDRDKVLNYLKSRYDSHLDHMAYDVGLPVETIKEVLKKLAKEALVIEHKRGRWRRI